MKKKEGFFKAYYKNLKELNISLVIIIALFFVIVSGVTSYALFGTEVTGDSSISLTVGKPVTSDDCFDVVDGVVVDYLCYENNTFGMYAVYDVVIPSSIDGVPVTGIGEFAFESKGINSVVIPDGVLEIGTYAFNYNNLASVKIPDSVNSIFEGAFLNNNINSVVIKNKLSFADFENFGNEVFGFSSGYDLSNVLFE